MVRFLTVALGMLLAAPASAAEVSSFELENGMEVVVIEDHRAPVVVHMVWYRAGSADEPPGKSGIAHYLEHLLFKGTDNMASGEFSDVVASIGGTDNAFTSSDYTAYFQRVAASELETMMRMEADRMRNLRLTQEDILTERDVIIEERNQRVENEPGALFGEQRNAALYLNSPYGIPIIGWRHEMEALTLEDALEFYERFYAPNNAVLVVGGDVDPDEVFELAKVHYGPLAPTVGLPERMRPQEPPHLSERRLSYADPRVSSPYVVRTYLAPERDSGAQETAAALQILAAVLGGNSATSVLGQKLQFEERSAIYTSAFYSGVSLDDTTFGLLVAPVPGVGLEEAEAAMDRVIAEFMDTGVDQEQLDRIKMNMRAARIYGDDNIQNLTRRYGQALTSGLTLEDIEAWPDILQGVTAEDVMAAARGIFDSSKSVTGYLKRPDATEVSQ